MIDLFGTVVVDRPVKINSANLPKEKTLWKVASWYSREDRWKIWSEEWLTREAANKWAENDLSKIQGHTHYCILEVILTAHVVF